MSRGEIDYECNGWHFYQLFNFFVKANDRLEAMNDVYREDQASDLEKSVEEEVDEFFEKRDWMDTFFEKETISAFRFPYEGEAPVAPSGPESVPAKPGDPDADRNFFGVESTSEFVEELQKWDERDKYVSEDIWYPTIEEAKQHYSELPAPYLVMDIASAIEYQWTRSEDILEEVERIAPSRQLPEEYRGYHKEAEV